MTKVTRLRLLLTSLSPAAFRARSRARGMRPIEPEARLRGSKFSWTAQPQLESKLVYNCAAKEPARFNVLRELPPSLPKVRPRISSDVSRPHWSFAWCSRHLAGTDLHFSSRWKLQSNFSSNLRAEPGIWQRSRPEAGARRPGIDFQRRHRSRPAPQPRCPAFRVQHHRRSRREMGAA